MSVQTDGAKQLVHAKFKAVQTQLLPVDRIKDKWRRCVPGEKVTSLANTGSLLPTNDLSYAVAASPVSGPPRDPLQHSAIFQAYPFSHSSSPQLSHPRCCPQTFDSAFSRPNQVHLPQNLQMSLTLGLRQRGKDSIFFACRKWGWRR